jgi:hypothetical protein
MAYIHIVISISMFHVCHRPGDESSKNYNYENLVTLSGQIITGWRAGHYTDWQYIWLLLYCITRNTQVMKITYMHHIHIRAIPITHDPTKPS